MPAATSPAASPLLAQLRAFFHALGAAFARATDSGAVVRPASRVVLLPDAPADDKAAAAAGSTPIAWRVRCVPALGEKQRVRQQRSTAEQQGAAAQKPAAEEQKDVFAPPYDSDLFVAELPDHTVLLNKYALLPLHFLLVTQDFASQKLPPPPATLALAYALLQEHARTPVGEGRSADAELMAFYNCGPLSGASQPHCHVQFIECSLEAGEKEDVIGARGEGRVPVERLLHTCIEQEGRDDSIFALPLPYQHFVALLSPPQGEASASARETYLMTKLLGLLDALFKAKLSAAAGDASGGEAAPPVRPGPPSFNLLMTTRAMHLVPRTQEDFSLPLASGEKTALSINSMAYAGHLLTKSEEELQALQALSGGVRAVLEAAGASGVQDVTMGAQDEPALAAAAGPTE